MEKQTYQSLQELPLMLSMMDVASVLGITTARYYRGYIDHHAIPRLGIVEVISNELSRPFRPKTP